MAGRESAGYAAATADLFAGRPWVLVPGGAASDAEVTVVTSLARACGARPVVMTAEAHDAAVAGISHLPLVVAVALVEAVAGPGDGPARADWPAAARLAAGGWRDMTRVARGDPQMGAAIVATNAPAIAARLRDLRAVLDDWLAVLERPGGPDEAARHRAASGRPARGSSRTRMDELVLVVPRDALPDGGDVVRPSDRCLDGFEALVAREGRFEPRAAMEVDPRFKQVIPYLVLRDGDRVLPDAPDAAGADARLHDRYSIGVGGHLNPGDGDLVGGLRREWSEEVVADFEPAFRLVALLNDDTTEVGSVHLGAVYMADAGGRPVAVRETDKLEGGFAPRDDVAAVVERMETWSRLVFESLLVAPETATTAVTGRQERSL